MNEPDAPSVRALAQRESGLCSSAFAVVELACVLQRHVREGALTRAQAGKLRQFFQDDIGAGTWTLFPVSDALLTEADRRVRALGTSVYVRAADALHLTTAADAGLVEVWTSDRHMLAAAPHFGLRGSSV